MLIDYSSTYLDVNIWYHTSDTQLYTDLDAAYLVLPKARHRRVEHFYLSEKLNNMHTIPNPKINGPMLTERQTLKNIMFSAAKSEVGMIYLNGKSEIPV